MFVHVFVERNCLWSDGMQQHIDLCYNIYVLTAQFKSMHKPFKQDQNFNWHQHYITCTWQLQDKKKEAQWASVQDIHNTKLIITKLTLLFFRVQFF